MIPDFINSVMFVITDLINSVMFCLTSSKKKKTVLPKKKKIMCMYMKAGMFFDNYLKKGSKCVKK